LFNNIFNKDSRPDTKTNTGANSLITIKDFSNISNKMSFKIEYGDSVIKPLFLTSFLNSNVAKITVLEDGNSVKFAFADGSDLLVTDGNNIISTIQDFHGGYKIASAKIGEKIIAIGNRANRINYWTTENSQITSGSIEIQYMSSASPVIKKALNETYDLIIGTTAGIILVYDLESIISGNPILKDSIYVAPLNSIQKISTSGSYIYAIANSVTVPGQSIFYSSDGNKIEFENENLVDLISTLGKNSTEVSAILTSSKKVYIIEGLKISSEFQLESNNIISGIAFSDIKQDGNNYILVNDGAKLKAYNLSGALADNYPVNKNSISNLNGTPLSVDFEGDSKLDIVISDSEGNIYAYDGGTGKLIYGFPISSGGQLFPNSVLFNYKGQTALGVFNEDQYFIAWIISSVSNTSGWLEENGNRGNTSFIPAAENINTINDFFPTSRAYNYPNPVYDGQTAIRYYVSEDSKINIKIFDLAGDYVAELNSDAQGGLDNETIWNVSSIQSGVYLARIEALGSSGKSESVIIKIAVVK